MRWQHLLSAAAVVVAASAIPAHAQDKPKAAKHEAKASKNAGMKKEDAGEKIEHKAFGDAEKAPAHWLKGVKLTATEKKSVTDIEKKYRKQLSDMHKTHEANEKAGKEDDSQLAGRVQAVVDQERAEIRAAIPAAQQAKFDANVAKK